MVLATSINLDALAVVSRNDSNLMRVMSEGYEMAEVDITDLKERFEETGTTIGLIRELQQICRKEDINWAALMLM